MKEKSSFDWQTNRKFDEKLPIKETTMKPSKSWSSCAVQLVAITLMLLLLAFLLTPINMQSRVPKPKNDGPPISVGDKIPYFPWPPPKPSATEVVPYRLILKSKDEPHFVRDIDTMICNELDKCGYSERSYYRVPEGFALATRLEQFNTDGTSKSLPDRWSPEVMPLRSFSFSRYLSALLSANPGHYRIIVFVVTPTPFGHNGRSATRQEAMAWLDGGLNRLPEHVGKEAYTEEHVCTALIYEYQQAAKGTPAVQTMPGICTGAVHLKGAGIHLSGESN